MYYLAVENNKTTSVLSDVRDALLPKLLSGEITPTDTQSSKEAVA
jgi:hypothetical protein